MKLISVLRRKNRVGKYLVALLLGLTLLGVSGCHTLSFYGQAVRGQYQIFANERPINKLIKAPSTPEPLRQRFELLERLRAFAQTDLKLPIDDHYRKYVDLHRQFVVWNVEAAPEFSMQSKTWWYPLLGSLEYRGYFSKQGATNYAHYLRNKGYDVSVGGVQAYSTLGWFRDPVLNTFIFEPDADLAEIIFHELGHQRAFARGDTDFNEAFATTVGQEGARRWLTARGDKPALEAYLAQLQRNNQFVHLVMSTRRQLEDIYGDTHNARGKVVSTAKNKGVPAQRLRQEKAQIMEEMKQQFVRLKQQWNGDTDYDGWLSHEINNAQLNSVAAYYDLVPTFEQILATNGGDLEKFYGVVERLAKMTKKQRQEQLRAVAPPESQIGLK